MVYLYATLIKSLYAQLYQGGRSIDMYRGNGRFVWTCIILTSYIWMHVKILPWKSDFDNLKRYHSNGHKSFPSLSWYIGAEFIVLLSTEKKNHHSISVQLHLQIWRAIQASKKISTGGNRYIDDVLSINNPDFENYLAHMYPTELEIDDTTESNLSASYLDLLLSIGRDGQLSTLLYDQHDDFNFHITNCPFLRSNIPSPNTYGVFHSSYDTPGLANISSLPA